MNDSNPILNKLTKFSRGELEVSALLQDPDLGAVLTELHKELMYPSSLSSQLDLPPFGLLKALNHSPLAIMITDPQAQIQYMNPQCEKLTGYPQKELLGKTPRIFKSGKTPEASYKEMWKTLSKGQSWFGELLNRRKNGSFYWEWISIAPVLNAQGEVVQYVAIKQDITQRKLAESELKYQSTLLDSLADAVLSTDMEMTILSWNRAAEHFYGWNESEAIGQNWLKIQPACIFEGSSRDETLQQVLLTGSWSGRVTQHHALGHELPVFVICSLVRNAQDEPAGLVIVNRDLSQHQALQKSLQESEARFKQVADHLEEGIWSINPSTLSLEYMSPSLARMAGLSYQALLAAPGLWQKFIHPEDLNNYFHFLQVLNLGDSPTQSRVSEIEYRFITPEGQEKWFSSRIYGGGDSSQRLFWGITQDITLRKRVQDEIVRSEQFAYGILGALSANICVLDKAGSIIAANEAWNCFSAENKGENDYLGWNYLDLCKQVRGNEREQSLIVAAGIEQILSGEETVFSIEYPCHSPEEQRWYELKANRIEGDIEGRVVIFHQNITAQKRSQEGLRRLNEHLEEEVQLRTQALNQSLKELRQANQQLVQANQMKDAFLANMSHELRTPLTGILGMADLLYQEVLGPLNPKQSKSLQTLRDSGQHLLTLINDILDLSKVEAGKLELHPEWVDIAFSAQQLLSMVKSMAEEKQVRLSLRVEPFDLKIWADPRSFKQMLVNLLSNAIKFTPTGGMVSLETRIQDNAVILAVTDTGIGIAEQDLIKLFKPFVQIDSGLSRKYAGTGLGLSLVKNLIEAHGGLIQVQSRVGKGSTFSLLFPLDPQAKLPVTELSLGCHDTELEITLNKKAMILLVDDNPINIEVIQSFLEYANYHVVPLSSGKEALLWLETETPDLILMDIQMPGMSGFEVIEQLRKFSRNVITTLPVIALTSLAMTGDQEKILKQGFDSYLSKPVDFKALRLMLDELLAQRKGVLTV
ncbi:MAG: PAS domain S-box protein [Candidatus Sericytochromatia bacterium]|nr:PAS domain S-box protein [Candidatus Sericytochromatia bacterium]